MELQVNQALSVVIRETVQTQLSDELVYYRKLYNNLKRRKEDYCSDCDQIYMPHREQCAKCKKHRCQSTFCRVCGSLCQRCSVQEKCDECEDRFCQEHVKLLECGCKICEKCTPKQCIECQKHIHKSKQCPQCLKHCCSECVQETCRACSLIKCGFCQEPGTSINCLCCEAKLHADCWRGKILLPLCLGCVSKCQL